jgi:hypothetical protein
LAIASVFVQILILYADDMHSGYRFPAALLAANTQWILEQSTLSYHVSHPLHKTNGVSKAARGKGVCHEGQCDFVVAVPVKSFDAGDSTAAPNFRWSRCAHVCRRAPRRLPAYNSTWRSSSPARRPPTNKSPFQLRAQGDSVKITGTIPGSAISESTRLSS